MTLGFGSDRLRLLAEAADDFAREVRFRVVFFAVDFFVPEPVFAAAFFVVRFALERREPVDFFAAVFLVVFDRFVAAFLVRLVVFLAVDAFFVEPADVAFLRVEELFFAALFLVEDFRFAAVLPADLALVFRVLFFGLAFLAARLVVFFVAFLVVARLRVVRLRVDLGLVSVDSLESASGFGEMSLFLASGDGGHVTRRAVHRTWNDDPSVGEERVTRRDRGGESEVSAGSAGPRRSEAERSMLHDVMGRLVRRGLAA